MTYPERTHNLVTNSANNVAIVDTPQIDGQEINSHLISTNPNFLPGTGVPDINLMRRVHLEAQKQKIDHATMLRAMIGNSCLSS